MKLERGDVAVVTGAAGGIGFALAERFATAGLHVVAADVEPGALDDAVTRLAEHGGEVLGVPTDVSREEQVQALATTAVERFGGVHVVCNNAGVVSRADPWLGPTEAWEWVFGVNLWGVIHGVRAFMPHLALGGRGHIVNTASMAGLFPGLNPIYDATKHAVVAISENLFHDMKAASLNVGVSVLCPGWVRTALIDAERNWTGDGEPPPVGAGLSAVEPHLRRATDEGMTPAAVAELVATCIEEDRFLGAHPPELDSR
ncbi:MAG: SDR family NAD(P)-dependent oxidoreductase [Acidimicrobiia bacterium]